MRITGGTLRGRKLTPPSDMRVRPTSDRVREAIFNILAHNDFDCGFDLDGALAADLFAGTGALGLEAISRGAKFCLFVEDAAESRALIRTNVEAFGLTGATKIWRRDATQLGPMGPGAGGPFTLVFLDPPYHKNLAAPALASLRDGLLAGEGRDLRVRMRGRRGYSGHGWFCRVGRPRLWRNAGQDPALRLTTSSGGRSKPGSRRPSTPASPATTSALAAASSA